VCETSAGVFGFNHMPEAQEAKFAGVVSFHLLRAESVVIFSLACDGRFVFFFLGF